MDARFKYFKRCKKPKGAPTCRNIGLEKAAGEYVIFLDSDDLLAHYCMEIRVEKFQQNVDNDFLVFQSVLFEESLDGPLLLWNIETDESDLLRFLRTEPLWQTAGAIYRASFIRDKGGFTIGLPFLQDTELGIKLLLDKPRYRKFLQEPPNVYIRQDSKSLTRKNYFLGSGSIILKRMEILYAIIKKIKSENKSITKAEENTLWNTSYFFSKYLLLEFGLKRDFNRSWWKSCKFLEKGFLNFLISLIYPYILYLRKYSKYSIKVGQVYYNLYHNRLPNIHEMKKIKLHSIPFDKSGENRIEHS